MMSTLDEMKTMLPEVVRWRRDFHAHPELGFQEVRTSAIVAQLLESFGIAVKTRFCKAETAVLGTLDSGRPGPVVAIRADMDALPMQDEKQVPYRSQTAGVCHACGHDGHTATLLGLARFCAAHRERLSGVLKFLFQPAEEGPAPGGVKLIMESGELDDVSFILGNHQSTMLQSGQMLVKYGLASAAGDVFDITYTGRGAHAVSPQDGNDVIMAAASAIMGMQADVARKVDPQTPAVLSVCSVQAGEAGAKNVLPSTARFSGTFRSFSAEVQELLRKEVDGTARRAAKQYGCACRIHREALYPPLVNDAGVTSIVEKAMRRLAGDAAVVVYKEASMGSEDFAWYAERIPASFFMYGVRNDAKGIVWPGHHPLFDIDEAAFPLAMAVTFEAAADLLGQKQQGGT